jgi:hypothetical protein
MRSDMHIEAGWGIKAAADIHADTRYAVSPTVS